jgi:hypothetical protein
VPDFRHAPIVRARCGRRAEVRSLNRLSFAAASSASGSHARWLPVAFGLLSALLSVVRWDGLASPAVIHDEAAYVLQARIFASGRLAAPAPPIPEFFEQFHVLVTPRLAPKYFPGHALLLVPGILLGLPALGPIVLNGIAGGLVFSLGRRVCGTAAAVLGWTLWSTAWRIGLFQTSYLSVTTSTALWLAGCHFLLRWWEAGRQRDLTLLSLSAAGLAITRPLTAVAFALPALWAVGVAVRRRSLARQLPAATVAGLLLLAIVPLWSRASTGSWTNAPYGSYARAYFPWDRFGFDESTAAPERELPADLLAYAHDYAAMRAEHSPAAAPGLFVDRVRQSFTDLFGLPRWRLALLPFFLVGVLALDGRGRFALAWPLVLFVLHLPRAHFVNWSVYYVECLWIVALATAAGFVAALRATLGERRRSARIAVTAALVIALVAAAAAVGEPRLRVLNERGRAYFLAFRARLAELPRDERTVTFVRYALTHSPHLALIENSPDFARERHWIARDRGEDNGRLLAVAGDRVPYLFDETSFRLFPLAAAPPARATSAVRGEERPPYGRGDDGRLTP